MRTTTAALLKSLDSILFEIDQMEHTVSAVTDVSDDDRRVLRRELLDLRHRAETLMTWLSNARLEESIQ
jgi:hypothetical protein